MLTWKDDDELFALMKKHLYSAVIGDILDKKGYLHQFLPPQVQPLRENMVLAGRAMPVLETDCIDVGQAGQNPVLHRSFGLMLEALDDLKKNEVYICSGSSPTYALVGELMCTRMKILGAAGAVVTAITAIRAAFWSWTSHASPMGDMRRIKRRAARWLTSAYRLILTAFTSNPATSSLATWTAW